MGHGVDFRLWEKACWGGFCPGAAWGGPLRSRKTPLGVGPRLPLEVRDGPRAARRLRLARHRAGGEVI